jgi:hypothetical protein
MKRGNHQTRSPRNPARLTAGKIDRSAAGLPLRLVSIVADVAGVYGAGKLIGL